MLQKVLAMCPRFAVNVRRDPRKNPRNPLVTAPSRPVAAFSSTNPKTNPKSRLVMKPIIPFALLGAFFAVGAAKAASTTPVGYETLTLAPGFNYLGLRLHEAPVVSGDIETVTSGTIVDSDVDLGALLDDTKTYILEVKNAAGVTQEFIGSAAAGGTITTPFDLSGSVAVNDVYTIRPASTLSSVFGAANQAGLDTGFFGPGGDLVLLPDGSGGFLTYYYDSGASSWADGSGNPVDGSTISIIYTDSIIISSSGAGATSLVVAGEVKTGPTNQALSGSSFNYISSVAPAGATLASAFDAAVPSLDKGFFGPGGDLFYVPNGSGGFNQYYYDDGLGSWADSGGNAVVASSIDLPSGVIVFNDGGSQGLLNSTPAFYSGL